MKKSTINYMVRNALMAALYVAITLAFQYISYGQIQFRISELLVLIVFIDPSYIPGLTLGCAVANLFSPLGIIDVIFGTTATFIALIFIAYISNKLGNGLKALFIASLAPVITNGIIIGLQLYYMFDLPLLPSIFFVSIGEFVVVSIVGVVLFKSLIERKRFVEYIKIK
ncbi:MAG: QueT transporter family protein [Tissierellales bacterium]|jgi:uncharacterized membrane protein|nr:QueT transporter family protein [Tissierellales bacterium]MBN2827113.1 QueT transporter family protein [Tissierellales bacterium]